ncbi:MAG: rRNA maturation RNase YbeY [Leptospirales bacterium]|nr:rRNA maturation RNase YbeY [Leptospirales bacterium]
MKAILEVFTEGIELPWRHLDEGRILTLAENICGILAIEDVSLSLIMTNDECIRKINREFRKKDSPTDVISFAYADDDDDFPHGEGGIDELGDIYISLERTAEQSVEYGVSLEDEFKRLLIHGILHLIGYDHEKSVEEENIMQAKEEEIFALV